nr:MAG TPA: hypothetical protein [Caudoviricetes sp.]
MNIVDIAKMKKLAGGGAAVVVDKLPEKDIKPNTIYAVKKVTPIYKIWLYGQSFNPLTSVTDDPQLQEMAAILVANGWTSEEVDGAVLIMLGLFVPIDINVDGMILQNIVDSTGFTLKFRFGDTYIVNKKFSTIDETYTYLFSPEHAVTYAAVDMQEQIEAAQTLLKSKGFTWSNDPIEGLGVQAVVDENLTVSYEYYIYNGQQWINLEGVKVVNELPSSGVGGVLYAVQSVDYYTSIFGTKMLTLTDANTNTWISTQESLFDANNRTLDEKEAYTTLAQLGFAVVEGIQNPTNATYGAGITVYNTYSNNYYTFSFEKDDIKIAYDFETLLDLQDYLFSEQYVDDIVELQGGTSEEQEKIKTALNKYVSTVKEMGFQCSDSTLSSSQIGLTVKDRFKYYLWNGTEYVETGNKVIIKEVNSLSKPANDFITSTEFDEWYDSDSLIFLYNDEYIYVNIVSKKESSSKARNIKIQFNETLYSTSSSFSIVNHYWDITKAVNNIITISELAYDNLGCVRVERIIPSEWSNFILAGTDYKWAAKIPISNLPIPLRSPEYIYVSVAFSLSDAVSGNFAPFGETFVDTDNQTCIRLYAKIKPITVISITYEVIPCQL